MYFSKKEGKILQKHV